MTESLQEFLAYISENWEVLPIRVYQDDKWQSLFLSEIKDGNQILDWIRETKGRFWKDKVNSSKETVK